MMKVLKTAPLPIVLLAFSLVCPTELSLYLGGLRLPPHRVALIVLFITALVRLFQAKPVQLMACDGLMMAYGQDYYEFSRKAAVYVDKILKGAKSADLPIEQPTAYKLAINQKTAKAIGISVPISLLVSADEVIE